MKDVNTFAVGMEVGGSSVGLELGNFIPVNKFLVDTDEWLPRGSVIHVINSYMKCKSTNPKKLQE